MHLISTELKSKLEDLLQPFVIATENPNPVSITDFIMSRLLGSFSFMLSQTGSDIYLKSVAYIKDVIIPHKIEVFKAGVSILKNQQILNQLSPSDAAKFNSNLYLHDISKMSSDELFAYATYDRKSGKGKKGFDRAWHHHKMNNLHHPEYWLNPNKSGELEVLEMPILYTIEMVADWIGAGKTYGSSLAEWLPENLHKFIFHSTTALDVKYILEATQDIRTSTVDNKITRLKVS